MRDSNTRNKNSNNMMMIPTSVCKILCSIQIPANSNMLSNLLTIMSLNNKNSNNNGLCY